MTFASGLLMRVPVRRLAAAALIAFWATSVLAAQAATNRYALIMEDPSVSTRYVSRTKLLSVSAESYQRQIEAKQNTLRRELASRNIVVTGAAQTLVNAVFVTAAEDREAELKSLPGVKAVIPVRRYRLKLNRATPLVNAPAAWGILGGEGSAGAGIKIAILDTGIDQTHPAFQDSALAAPAGFPVCSETDCSFTSNKVIVARSYVRQLAAGSSPNPAADSRPDDFSPRDRIGHGTAVASCAAGFATNAPIPVVGVAPKAYLGNYKIFGSPGWNDFSSDDVIVQALEDALHDGMDIASLSIGGPALSGPLDTGAKCGNPAGAPCDVLAYAVENAVNAGMTVVAAAGNEGQDGSSAPTFNTISSPADAPDVIAVGATTNSHVFVQSVRVPGDGVPSNLQQIGAVFGDGFMPASAVTAPLRDITALGNDGLGCIALPAGSLTGAFALIQRGTCTFLDKVLFARAAGAVGVVFYMADQAAIFSPGGLSGTGIPAAMISNSDGVALKSFLASSPDRNATLDPTEFEQNTAAANLLAGFSSLGPSTGDAVIKPDLLAVGTNMYIAAQTYDVLGGLYSASGYTVANGTSFAAPMVAGAAALVKQVHPAFTPAQVRSALVNTASPEVVSDDSGNPVSAQSIGAGKLNAGAAVQSVVTSTPATLSFGVLTSSTLPQTKQLLLTNAGAAVTNLTLGLTLTNGAPGVTASLDRQTLTLAPGASQAVSITLSGAVPAAGSYSGAVAIDGAAVSLRVPFEYFVGTGIADNIIPLTSGPSGTFGDTGMIAFKLIDRYGVPITGAATTFRALDGGGFESSASTTDANGIAAAKAFLGTQPGSYRFQATAGGYTAQFSGTARPKPAIAANGIVNGSSFETGKAVAPGSYISIFGTALSDTVNNTSTARLPIALDYAAVSFDVPSAGISVPGHVIYVSPRQINVQVPWELQGQASAQVKVTVDFAYGNLYTLPLASEAPALFEFSPGTVAALDASYNAIGASNPARRGQVIQLFANGLGPVTNQPASGEPAPLSPLAETVSTPVVTIGGLPAPVSFSGLAPGFAGLYQINATVPELGAGTYAITVAIGASTSKASAISVQ